MTKFYDYKPLITVYIPTFNRVDLLRRAVDSVRNQTYQNLEIIIVDDCSTDGTHEYLKAVTESDSRVKYYIKNSNSGACQSRNIAIENANGEYITGLDDDDFFHPNRISIFLKYARKNPNRIYCTSYNIQKQNGRLIKPSLFSYVKNPHITHRNLLRKNTVSNQVFVKTQYLRESGGFDTNLKAWQDLECWYNLMKSRDIKAFYIKKPTQTIDVSHEGERISTKGVDNIIKAYNYFCSKHKLNSYEKFLLESHMVRHMPNEYSTLKKVILLGCTGNYYILKNILRLI